MRGAGGVKGGAGNTNSQVSCIKFLKKLKIDIF